MQEILLKESKILIVDDVDTNLELLESILTENGYKNIVCINDSEKALNLLQESAEDPKKRFDLVLLDIMMPKISGYDFIKIANENPKVKPIPIIVITAVSSLDSMRQTFIYGAIDYITKPIDINTLLNRVKVSLEINQYRKESAKNKAELEAEFKLARAIQNSFLPVLEEDEHLKLNTLYRSLGKVSGDTYDIYKISDTKYCVSIIDVVGHGVPAAFVTVMLNSLSRNYDYSNFSTGNYLSFLNEYFLKNFTSTDILQLKFTMTVLFIDFETHEIIYSNSSHPDPIMYKKNEDKAKVLNADGLYIGIFDMDFEEKRESFSPGDKILLYTDGVFDYINKDSKKILGYDEFVESMKAELKEKSTEQIILDYVEFIQGENIKITDDITLIALELKK